MLPTIDLTHVYGGAGSDWATGGFWTGRTREEEERRSRGSSVDPDPVTETPQR